MSRIIALSLVLAALPIVLAPQASAQRGHDACVRDVSRFCRAHMNDDDQTVLACLKQHRSTTAIITIQSMVTHSHCGRRIDCSLRSINSIRERR